MTEVVNGRKSPLWVVTRKVWLIRRGIDLFRALFDYFVYGQENELNLAVLSNRLGRRDKIHSRRTRKN